MSGSIMGMAVCEFMFMFMFIFILAALFLWMIYKCTCKFLDKKFGVWRIAILFIALVITITIFLVFFDNFIVVLLQKIFDFFLSNTKLP